MAEAKPAFGTRAREPIRASESGISYQTLKPGRLVRVGVLTMQTDADTQLDLSSPSRTVVADPTDAKGEIRNDVTYGPSRWRLVAVRRSNDPRLRGRSVWIGWGKDDEGKLTQPIMHPASKTERPTLGLEKV